MILGLIPLLKGVESGSRSWMVGPQRACRRWRMKRKAARRMSGVSVAMMIHIKGVLYNNQNISCRNQVFGDAEEKNIYILRKEYG